ncbi:hypothetical protein CCHR01_12117 [Colletotrichum chrysophilum]|uniref:Uncharacterized protein n=1 Tax=Colletotrichum chrysophilum TaxID=1836956 RepID=A0AAD9ACT2_9PEZI|nr:hypothetical protein CCHR01_12117 [Colletotrichum chrysophilum]
MPSFAWRSDAVFLQDTRSTVDHHPIRQSTELSFLSRTPQPIVSMDYLHEFQTSICLTGRSTSSWTAVCLVDSYFEETADPGNDYLMSEYDEADEGGHKSRNLAQRNVNSNRLSRLDPREYFLRIVKRRISRTKEEWINTSYKIQSSIHSGIYDSPIPVTPRSSSLGSANEKATLIENAEAWFRQTSRLLSRLIAVLSKSNDAWHKFVQRDLDLLNKEADHKTVVGIDGCLCCISDSIEEMETVLESMIQLERELENFQRKLSFHVAVDGGRAIKLQQWNVTILQFVSPMALAGSIMQAGLVVGDAYVWFLFLTVLLTSLTFSLSWFVRKWESFTSPLLSPDPTLQLSSQEVRIREREPFQPVLDAATRLPSSPDPMAQQAVAELKLGGKRFSPMVSTESSTKLLWM